MQPRARRACSRSTGADADKTQTSGSCSALQLHTIGAVRMRVLHHLFSCASGNMVVRSLPAQQLQDHQQTRIQSKGDAAGANDDATTAPCALNWSYVPFCSAKGSRPSTSATAAACPAAAAACQCTGQCGLLNPTNHNFQRIPTCSTMVWLLIAFKLAMKPTCSKTTNQTDNDQHLQHWTHPCRFVQYWC